MPSAHARLLGLRQQIVRRTGLGQCGARHRHVAQDRREDIVEVVGDAARQQAKRLQPGCLRVFRLNPERVGDVAEGQDHADHPSFQIAQRCGAFLDRPFAQIARDENRRSAGAKIRGAARQGRDRHVAGLARLRLETSKHHSEVLAHGLLLRPAGQRFRNAVDQEDGSVQIRRHDAVADAAQRHRQALLFLRERLLGPARLQQRIDGFLVQPRGLFDVPLLVFEALQKHLVCAVR